MSDESTEDREYAPSQKKLDEARQRGDAPRSADLSSAFALLGFLVSAVIAGPAVVAGVGGLGVELLGRADRLAALFLTSGSQGLKLVFDACLAAGALLLGPLFGALLGHLLQRNWALTPANIAPKLSRVSLLANAKQRFGLNGLVEFVKSTVKAALILGVLILSVRHQLPEVIATSRLSAGEVSLYLADQSRRFTVIVLVIAIVIGLADAFWQHFRFVSRNRMSRKEVTDEQRDAEGDPHAKSHRRRKAQDLALNQMIAEVQKADVVIVNPTHYAVALRWDRGRRSAPICVAKGVDEIALRIRDTAAAAGIPVRGDPPTARAIHATVAVGEEIHPDHYRAVAAAIRFAEAIRRRARGRR